MVYRNYYLVPQFTDKHFVYFKGYSRTIVGRSGQSKSAIPLDDDRPMEK